MADETNPTAPGMSTSEGKLTLVAIILGTVLEGLASVLPALQDSGHAAPWFPTALAVVGVLLQVASFLGYTKSRTILKATAIASESAPPKQ